MGRRDSKINMRNYSINKAIILFIVIFLLAAVIFSSILYTLTSELFILKCSILFHVFIFLCIICLLSIIRKKILLFSNTFCSLIDNMLNGKIEQSQVIAEEDTLFYKIDHQLRRLYNVMEKKQSSIDKEKVDLQELISDISHQVKTPLANLKMINSTLLEKKNTPEKQQEFLVAQMSQLDKLEFLLQSLIKTSRLETGVISLSKAELPIYDTLASALGGILLSAEKKRIDISVNCPEFLVVAHDKKWTQEALFNVLDNAVKYTPIGGKIQVSVECWEMFLKIDISDNGIGILEQHQGAIFKRFYRESTVHDIEGVGIGLYLAREIIILQGGYIKVFSELGKGSVFSIFLPRS